MGKEKGGRGKNGRERGKKGGGGEDGTRPWRCASCGGEEGNKKERNTMRKQKRSNPIQSFSKREGKKNFPHPKPSIFPHFSPIFRENHDSLVANTKEREKREEKAAQCEFYFLRAVFTPSSSHFAISPTPETSQTPKQHHTLPLLTRNALEKIQELSKDGVEAETAILSSSGVKKRGKGRKMTKKRLSTPRFHAHPPYIHKSHLDFNFPAPTELDEWSWRGKDFREEKKRKKVVTAAGGPTMHFTSALFAAKAQGEREEHCHY